MVLLGAAATETGDGAAADSILVDIIAFATEPADVSCSDFTTGYYGQSN